MNYQETAKNILKHVGGKGNVDNVMHCATRLRFAIKQKDKVNKDELSKVEGVLGVSEGAGQIQVVIGGEVDDVYHEVRKLVNINTPQKNAEKQDEQAEKKKLSQRLMDFFSNAFIPLLPALVASGLIKGFVAVANAIGILPTESSSYIILTAIGNASFYFIPIFVAYNIAKYYNANVVIPMVVMAALLEPNIVSLMGGENPVTLFGLGVIKASYSSQILIAITAIPLCIMLERYLNQHIHKNIRLIVVPFVTLVVTTSFILLLLGPITVTIADWIANLVLWLNDHTSTVLGLFLSGASTYMTMAGLHMALGPLIMFDFTKLGRDPLIAYMSMACYAQMGAGFAIWLRSKRRDVKSMALATSITALFTGVTEPIIFGLCMKYQKSFLAIAIGSAAGGAILGFFKVYSYGIANAGLLGLAVYYSDTFVYYLIGAAVSLFLTFFLTLVLAFKKEEDPNDSLLEETEAEA